MKRQYFAAALLLGAGLAGCRKPENPPERVPVPKTEAPAAVAASTAPAVDQNPLTAPGTYLRTTVGRVQEAKDAKALYEQTARQGLKNLDLNDTGGN